MLGPILGLAGLLGVLGCAGGGCADCRCADCGPPEVVFGLEQDPEAPRTLDKPISSPVSRAFPLWAQIRYGWNASNPQGPFEVSFPALPQGVHATVFPNPFTPAGTFFPQSYGRVTVTLDPGVQAGTLKIPMQFKELGLTRAGSLELQVADQPVLELYPVRTFDTLTLVPGGFGWPLDLQVASSGGASGPVQLSVDAMPAGLTAVEETAPHPSLRRLRIRADATAYYGSPSLPITIRQGPLARARTVSLFVSNPGWDFGVEVTPQTMVLGPAGGTASSTVSIQRIGTPGAPGLTVNSQPAGFSVTTSPDGSDRFRLALQVPPGYPPGLYPLSARLYVTPVVSHTVVLYVLITE